MTVLELIEVGNIYEIKKRSRLWKKLLDHRPTSLSLQLEILSNNLVSVGLTNLKEISIIVYFKPSLIRQ